MASSAELSGKENYSAWKIDFSEFFKIKTHEEKIKFLLKFAVLAPSSHNSQPWHFEIKNDALHARLDADRMLPYSDPGARQACISLGCAVENLLVAADYFGLETKTEYLCQAGNPAGIMINFVRTVQKKESIYRHLVFSIPKRRTNRNKYFGEVPIGFWHRFWNDRFQNWSLVDSGVHLNFVSDQKRKNLIADAVLEGLSQAMAREDFREELSRYVKNNYTTSHVGMPGFGLGMPGPVSVIAPFLLKHFDMSKAPGQRKKDEDLLKKHTPTFCILSTPGDDPENWLKAGQAYQRIALEADRAGLKTAAMAAAIEIGEHYKTLQEVLRTARRPQVFFRIGYCDSDVHPSPRLPAEDVMERRP
jgi:putative nitroreductase